MASSFKPPKTSTVTKQVTRTRRRTKFEPLWYVILHDDQLHTYQYVIEMLTKLFHVSAQEALMRAIEVDTQSVTIVARLAKAKAQQKRDEVMNYGGDPLMGTSVSMKASIEPRDD